MSSVGTERVLVVPTQVFREIGHFQGFSNLTEPYLAKLFRPEHVSYRPRDEVEQDPSYKQLIPYVIFRHEDTSSAPSIFQYTRGTGQGEGRLHCKRSIGIGGHIASVDADGRIGSNAYEEGMRRELEEEVTIDTTYREQCVGMINDDETEVGRVHLGIVHVFDVERPAVHPRESEIVDAGFRSVEEISEELDQFETWSQIGFRALFPRGGLAS